MGCEGKVEEAQGVMKLVDQLKEERDVLTAKVIITLTVVTTHGQRGIMI